jgi:hypothetical protein
MNQENLLNSMPLKQGVFVFLEKDGVETIGFGSFIGLEDVGHTKIPKVALHSENIYAETEADRIDMTRTILLRHEFKRIVLVMGLILPNTTEVHNALNTLVRLETVANIRQVFSLAFSVNTDLRYLMYRK